jgi:hypothetical protein
MDRESANSNIHMLILIRPADSLHLYLSAFGLQRGYKTTMCSCIYDVLMQLGQTPEDQTPVLILRPASLSAAASQYLMQHFKSLRMIGWLDADERLDDRALLPDVVCSMVFVNSLEQLEHAICTLSKKGASEPLNQSAQSVSGNIASNRLDYDVSDEEINALLGVNL